ncbi:MAG TPA: tetratricopeptide repeat protein [Bacteroidia bacterium]
MVFLNACKPRKVKSNPNGAVEQSEFSFDDYFIDANTHFNNGNYETALKLYEKCLALKPEVASVYYQISRIQFSQKDYVKGLQNSARANELDPANVYYATFYAFNLNRYGTKSKGPEILETCYKLNPKDELVVKSLDTIYALNGMTDKSISLWNNYIETKGFNIRYALRLIDLYKSKSDFASAHKQYDAIKKAAPRKFKYFIDDGNLYLEQKDEENAMKNFEKALSISPDNYSLNISLYKYQLKKNNKALSLKYLEQAFADPNTNFETKSSICSEINSKVKTDTSYLAFTSPLAKIISKQYPSNFSAQSTAGRFYELNGNQKEAFTCYKNATNSNPNYFDAWIGGLRCAKGYSSKDTLLKFAEKAIEFFPFTATIYLEASKSAASMKLWKEAESYGQTGVRYSTSGDSTKFKLILILANAQMQLSQLDAAIATIASVDNNFKGNYDLYELTGDVYYKKGDVTKALEFWNKAKDAGSKNPILDRKLNEKKYIEQ